MGNHQKIGNNPHSVLSSVLLGSVVCTLVSLLLCALVACLVKGEQLQESSVVYAANVAMAISTFLGTLAATIGKEKHLLIICCLTAALSYIILLGGGALIYGSGFHGLGTGAIMVLAGSGCVMLLKAMPKSKRSNHKIKYGFR